MGVMLLGKRAGLVQEPLPVTVERWAEDQVGLADRTGPGQELALGMGGHLLFSAALGAGYGALRAALDLPSLPSGPLYGLGLYAVNLLGIGPALDITRGPTNERPMTVGRRLMLHAFYGTATALVADRARAALR